jgi:hypothetical protein
MEVDSKIAASRKRKPGSIEGLRISAPAAWWPGPKSHLNAVTVLIAAFATPGPELKA